MKNKKDVDLCSDIAHFSLWLMRMNRASAIKAEMGSCACRSFGVEVNRTASLRFNCRACMIIWLVCDFCKFKKWFGRTGNESTCVISVVYAPRWKSCITVAAISENFICAMRVISKVRMMILVEVNEDRARIFTNIVVLFILRLHLRLI